MAGDAQERMGIFRVWKTQQASEEALRLAAESKSDVFVNLPTGLGNSGVFQALPGALALSIVYSYVEPSN